MLALYFKVEAGRASTSVRSGDGNGFAAIHPVTLLFDQGLVVRIQANVAITVVYDQQVARTSQPVREYNAPRVYGADRGALRGADDNSLALQVAAAISFTVG